MTCPLFVAGEDKVKVGRLVDRIEDGQDSTAWVTENVFDIVSKHHFMENLTAREADEGVV